MNKYRIDKETGALIFAPVSSLRLEDLRKKVEDLEKTISEIKTKLEVLEKEGE